MAPDLHASTPEQSQAVPAGETLATAGKTLDRLVWCAVASTGTWAASINRACHGDDKRFHLLHEWAGVSVKPVQLTQLAGPGGSAPGSSSAGCCLQQNLCSSWVRSRPHEELAHGTPKAVAVAHELAVGQLRPLGSHALLNVACRLLCAPARGSLPCRSRTEWSSGFSGLGGTRLPSTGAAYQLFCCHAPLCCVLGLPGMGGQQTFTD